jgi:hypothetical protein
LFTTGSFISKIFTGTMILFGITLLVAAFFRRSFCGLICPFGSIQEFFAKVGQKIFKKKLIISSFIDRSLRYGLTESDMKPINVMEQNIVKTTMRNKLVMTGTIDRYKVVGFDGVILY